MSRSAKISLEWADGEYEFRLGIGELKELQEKTRRVRNADGDYQYFGPMKLFAMLSGEDWVVDDVRETIRIGLIGAGTKPTDALRLVKRYVEEVPDWTINCKVAANIVAAAVLGWEVEPLGKPEGQKASTEPMTNGSPSPHSTQMQQ
jgi:hypothetical protein